MSDANETNNHERWEFEQNVQFAMRAHGVQDQIRETAMSAAVATGSSALRAMLLINGGAGIAILAFLGNFNSSSDNASGVSAGISVSLFYFALGVFLVCLAMSFAYFSNYATSMAAGSREYHYDYPYVRETDDSKYWGKWINPLTVSAIIFGLCSLISYFFGMLKASEAINLL